MSRKNTHVKKGDPVKVISGVYKNATGTILQVYPEKEQVLVEGVRMIKKHTRKSQDNPEGGIVTKEGPIHISNVKRVTAAKKAAKKSAKKATKKAAKKASSSSDA